MISVVIPTHNRQVEVCRAVKSVATQSMRPAEIVVVDDASSPPVQEDDLAAVADGIPIKLIRHESPTNPAFARNAGIEAAKEAWIAFLDDDDQFLSTKIAVCIEAIKANPSIDLIYHAAEIDMVNEGARYTTRLTCEIANKPLYRRLLARNVVGGTPMVVARRDALRRVNGFDTELAALEDYELWLRLARSGAVFLAIDQALTRCDYVTRKRSVTKSNAAGQDTFSLIRTRYRADFNQLSVSEQKANARWVLEIELHRALLRLDHAQTLNKAWRLATFSPNLKSISLALLSLLGPRTILLLRAKL